MENNKNHGKSKLRTTETSTRSRHRSHSSVHYDTDTKPSFLNMSKTQEQNEVQKSSGSNSISGSHLKKSGGRGMAIQQMFQSHVSLSKNTDPNFSNANIEFHFNNLKNERQKKLNAENEKTWGKLLHSDKTS